MKKILGYAALLAACTAMPALADDAKMCKAATDMMFKLADTNNDGMISKSEFTDYEMKKFDMMDINHDGMLSKDEVEAFKKSEMQMIKSGAGMENTTTNGMSTGSPSMTSTRSSVSNDSKTNADTNKQ